MKVGVLGLWHLGSVTAACTAAAGIPSIGVDDDAVLVADLARGKPPLEEPGLAELIRSGLQAGSLSFSSDRRALSQVDVLWVCYDTPVDDEDRADVGSVLRGVESCFAHLKDGAVVLMSSQLPVGSVARLEKAFASSATGKKVRFACSPENLRLGRAIELFRQPGRIICGVRDDDARAVLEPLLSRFCQNLIWMSVESAEMVKHALNAFLATSITFINEIAMICERVDADAAEVAAGLRSDPRIGPNAYVNAGPAFAGGTLARDVRFLRDLAGQHGLKVPIIDGILDSNRSHGRWAFTQLRRHLDDLATRTVAVLGLAYKPGTSTLRRSSSIELVRELLQEGASVRTFDPQVTALPDDLAGRVVLAPSARAAARGAHALVVATEWPEFRELSPDDVAGEMIGRLVLDPGRFLGPDFARDPRFSLICVGRVS
jgi:UDPglucose 6-dehydrogenase